MLTLRTNDFQAAWAHRSQALGQQRLNQYRDVLLDYLKDKCHYEKSSINSSLLTRCMVADNPKQLYAVLFSYRDTVRNNMNVYAEEELYDECASVSVKQPRCYHDYCEEEEEEATVLKPQRIDTIVRKTTLLPLLSREFGPEFWVSRVLHTHADVPEPSPEDPWRIVEYQLRLNFYPNGLPDYLASKIEEAYEAYLPTYTVPSGTSIIVTHCK
jgi:hypothetical protein